MKAESGVRDARPQDGDGRENRWASETEALGAVPSSGRTDRSRLVLSVVAVIVGIPGFVAVGAGLPNVETVAFGATSFIVASVVGCSTLVWKANRHDAVISAMLLAGALGLAFTVVYALIYYREIYEIPIHGDSSPSACKQALALICGPVMVGLWFPLLGLGTMRKARKKGGEDKREPEARERQKQEQGTEENRRQS